jgi:bisphosphoglycerate-dependent phosphoglycerate mutase
MKLTQFVKALEKILENVDNPDLVDVRMADCIPVVAPILKDNTVFITDRKK